MNEVDVRNFKLHQILFFHHKKVYHDSKRHLTWVCCALTTLFYFFVPQTDKNTLVYRFFVIFET